MDPIVFWGSLAGVAAVALVDWLMFARRAGRRGTFALTTWEKGVRLVFVAGLIGGAATGFLPRLGQTPLRGWFLLAHVWVAPLFLAGLTASCLTWAHRCGGSADFDRPRLGAARRGLFWACSAAGFATAASILITMTSWVGQAGQAWLYDVHRVSATVLLAAALGQAYTILARPVAPEAAGDSPTA